MRLFIFSHFPSITSYKTEGLIESTTEDGDDGDGDDDDEPKNQNYFCFIDPTKILLQNVNREFLGNYR